MLATDLHIGHRRHVGFLQYPMVAAVVASWKDRHCGQYAESTSVKVDGGCRSTAEANLRDAVA